MLKKFLAAPIVQFLIGRAIGLYMHLVGGTTRWRRVNHATAQRIWAGGEAVIGCIWHGRFLLAHKIWSFEPGVQKPKMLISQSREGGIITHASLTVRAQVIRGSTAKEGKSSKGGYEALREMVRHLGQNGMICMTPDGPRGPRMRVQQGPLQLAKLSGAPLLATAWSTRWRIVFDSWDRFVLPLPFGRGVIIWGEPIFIARDADNAAMDAARMALEAELLRITAEADRLAGVDVIEPAPAIERAPTPEPAAT
jgi:lysophospholipid acyltransferase (LPLAT)-like uncharacterized protein